LRILSDIVLLALIVTVTWWLSGYDVHLTGDNSRRDHTRRAIRTGATLLLLAMLMALPSAEIAVPFAVLIGGVLSLTWAWCIAECASHGINLLTGAHGSKRDYDPHHFTRNLDTLACLLRYGQREEALKLAETLKASGDANVLAVETLLERAGIPQNNTKKLAPLAEANRLHVEGKPNEAEIILRSLLAENPSNVEAALMLMRIYVQDFRRSDKATEVLRALEKQPHISKSHIEYAARSIHEWGRRKGAPAAEILPESADGLIAAGYLGSAIEKAESVAKEQSGNLEAQLRVAEIYALHAGDIHRAERIVKKIGEDPAFDTEQVEAARTRLQEWREAKPADK
jgi:tetratricopeptide (TPR) repeat protein